MLELAAEDVETAPAPEPAFSVVCLSPQEWDTDLPTNRQQIMRRLARRGHRVVFVETGAFLGRHLAELPRRDRRRHVLPQLLGPTPVEPNIAVRKALNVAPGGHGNAVANTLNCRLTAAAIRRAVHDLPQPIVLWLYDPCTAAMIGSCDETLAVYDCVDDHAQLVLAGGRKRAYVAACDAEAARHATVVATTTTSLYRRHAATTANTHLVRNVADFDHFVDASVAAEVADLPGPVVGFAGNLLRDKVDFALLDAVAARADWTLLLVGPVRASAEADVARLAARPNVCWVGAKPYAEVPGYVAAFDVGLCPYEWNEWMRSGYPLKLYEYLAAGIPVVASGNPDLAGMEPDVRLVRGAEAFVAAVEAALRENTPSDRRRRIELARRNTWETRTQHLVDLVGAALG